MSTEEAAFWEVHSLTNMVLSRVLTATSETLDSTALATEPASLREVQKTMLSTKRTLVCSASATFHTFKAKLPTAWTLHTRRRAELIVPVPQEPRK